MPDEPLMAAGLDSLGTVELRNTLESTMKVSLPPTLAMDYPTAAAIAQYIMMKSPAAATREEDSRAVLDVGDHPQHISTPVVSTLKASAELDGALAITASSHRLVCCPLELL